MRNRWRHNKRKGLFAQTYKVSGQHFWVTCILYQSDFRVANLTMKDHANFLTLTRKHEIMFFFSHNNVLWFKMIAIIHSTFVIIKSELSNYICLPNRESLSLFRDKRKCNYVAFAWPFARLSF